MSQVKLSSAQSPLHLQLYSHKRTVYLTTIKAIRLAEELGILKVSTPPSLNGKTISRLQDLTKYVTTFKKVTPIGIVTKYPEIIAQLKKESPQLEGDPFLQLLFKKCLEIEPEDLEHLATHFEEPIYTLIQTARRCKKVKETSSADLNTLVKLLLEGDYILTVNSVLVEFKCINTKQKIFLEQVAKISTPITKQVLNDFLAHNFLSPHLRLNFQNPQEASDCAKVFHSWDASFLVEQVFDFLVQEKKTLEAQELANELNLHLTMVRSFAHVGDSLELLETLHTTSNHHSCMKFYEKAISNVIHHHLLDTNTVRKVCEALEIFLDKFKVFPSTARELFKDLALFKDPSVIHEFSLKVENPFLKAFFLVLYSSILIQVQNDINTAITTLKEFHTIKEMLHPQNRAQLEKYIKDNFDYLIKAEKFKEAFMMAWRILGTEERELALIKLTFYEPVSGLEFCLKNHAPLTKLDLKLFINSLKFNTRTMTPIQLYDTCVLIVKNQLFPHLEHFAKSLDSFYLRKLKPLIDNKPHSDPAINQGECFILCCHLVDLNNTRDLKQAVLGLNKQLFIDIYTAAKL